MKRSIYIMLVAIAFLMAGTLFQSAVNAAGKDKDKDKEKMMFKTNLRGYDRVPPVSTTASGEFSAKVSRDESGFDFEFNYENLSGDLTDLHLQFGQPDVNGGVIAHLCPEDTGCPLGSSGRVAGHVDAEEVVGPAAQGIAPGEFGEVLKAMRAGMLYINAHSTQFPAGEIRGQVK